MKKRFLSYGAGMQTFALLVMAEQGDISIDEVVFADTGAEHPETYEHIEKVAKPICKRMGIEFTTVRMEKEISDLTVLDNDTAKEYMAFKEEISKNPKRAERIASNEKWGKDHGVPRVVVNNLRDEILKRRIVPSINPTSRWCTSDSKIVPIYRGYIRPMQAQGEYIKPAVALIGLGQEELLRRYKPNLSEYTVEYPLIDRKMYRKDCVEYVEKHGYPAPPKSGCYFCPFQSRKQWGILLKNHADLYWDSVMLEEHDLNFPAYGLLPKGSSLRKLSEYFSNTEQKKLTDDYDSKEDMACEDAGYCHV
jgi:hypothetical protein